MHVVISEVQITGGPGNTTNDFIELWNPGDQPVSIAGWKLKKKTQVGTESSINTFDEGSVIPAHGFFLWANSADGFASSISANESTSASISNNNSIALLNADGNLVDSLGWGEDLVDSFSEGAFLSQVLESNQSYERKAWTGECVSAFGNGGNLGNGCDTESNATDFEVRLVSNPQNSSNTPEP
jgi:predicted extracellular nuclease